MSPDRIRHPDDLDHLGHVVHADDVCTGEDRGGDGGSGAPDPVRGGHVPERGSEEGLPRGTTHEWPAERGECREAGKHREGVFGALGESQPGVEQNPARVDTGIERRAVAVGQLPGDVCDHVVVGCPRVHVGRPSASVHQDDSDATGRYDAGHVPIECQRADVIDDVDTKVKSALGNGSSAQASDRPGTLSVIAARMAAIAVASVPVNSRT